MNLEHEVLEILCQSKRGLAFNEVYEKLLGRHKGIRKIEVREILSKLIRTGKVERVADYERRRMVFRSKSGCEESPAPSK